MAIECAQIALDSRVKLVEHLDLSCNQIGFPGLCNLVGPKSNLSNLKTLLAFSCSIQHSDTELGVLKKFKAGKGCLKLENLRKLNLSYNNLAQIAHTIFSPQFSIISSKLESLFLVEIGLEPESWAYLKTQLPSTLFELDLSQNNCVTFDLG